MESILVLASNVASLSLFIVSSFYPVARIPAILLAPYASSLKDVLTRLPTQRASQIDELLPHNWRQTVKV